MSLPTPINVAAVTITSAAAGASQDISAVTQDFTIELTVINLSAASGVPAATFVLEDSVDAFTGKIQRLALDLQEAVSIPTGGLYPQTFTWRKLQNLPNLRAGVGSAVARVNVLYLAAVGGASPSVTYAWRIF